MTTLDVIISTCNDRINNLSRMNLRPYPKVRYLVMHQIFDESIDLPNLKAIHADLSSRSDVDVHVFYEKGVSKSRNAGILKSEADICLISDDDLIYLDKALPGIIQAFEHHSNEDIIAFKMLTPKGEPFKQYPPVQQQQAKRLAGFYESILFNNPEIAFRRQSILNKDILFNEKIGVGSKFPLGEENLFLKACHSKRLNMSFFNFPICIVPNQSTRDREDLPIYFARGVVFGKIFGLSMTLHQIRKNLIDRCNPASWLKLSFYLAGNIYFLLRGWYVLR